MPDPTVVSQADSLGSLSAVVFFVFLGAALLIVWQVTIFLGALISNHWRANREEQGGPAEVG